ncbi:carbohydrate binding domain-containing protein [Enterobacter roggenkampii]|uniref:carbohydrate binding domain-containing protein n=1 Tax=Enterobacter roggenkampii TaxID=1812935 RepID=UPI002FFC00E8
MATELVSNGDFSDGKGQWQFTNQNSTIIGEEEVIITNPYCKIATTEAIYQSVPLKVGFKYRFSMRKRGALSGKIALFTQGTNDEQWSTMIPNSNSWENFSGEFTVQTTWQGPFWLRIFANPGSSDAYLEVDDISLTLSE